DKGSIHPKEKQGAEPPKTKASVRKKQSSYDTTVPPPTPKGKRIKTSTKVDKPAKEKQPAKTSTAKGLTVLSEVILAEAKQIKLATKRSLTQTHILHANRSGTDKGTGIIPGVLDVPAYESNDEESSWKSNADDDDDEVKIREHDDDVDDQKQALTANMISGLEAVKYRREPIIDLYKWTLTASSSSSFDLGSGTSYGV
nr:hypothetical protein [Tanacetum cinerariifolium]